MQHKIKNPKINIVTLGCSKNVVDSENFMGHLHAGGLDVVHDSDAGDADVVLINTCGFIHDAKEESVQTILAYTEAKKSGYPQKVYVTGCLIQRYKTELQEAIPEVDGFFGLNEWDEMFCTIGIHLQKAIPDERIISTPKHYAYLKVAEGCNRSCSYCAIPLIRGRNISRPIEDLVAEAKQLVSQGVKEIILIAQDLTYYGLDIYKKRKLGELLHQLAPIKGLEWIRLHYTYPAQFPDDVLYAMRDYDNICKYIDVPLQHIDTEILHSMNRGIDSEGTIAFVEKVRRILPDAALRTTFIIGYPGETKAKFEALKKFVEQTRFDRLGVFAYSPEEGTPAYGLGNPVSEKMKQQRMDEIMDLQQNISLEINQAKIGKTFKVIIDREESDYWIGRTEFDSPEVDNEVLITKQGKDLQIGNFYQVKITDAEMFDLFGEIV